MNPFGETAPREPLPGGCGSVLCAQRAWVAMDLPDDEGVIPPCDACAVAAVAVLAARQEVALRPTAHGKARARRTQSPADRAADLRLSVESAGCHTVGPG